MFNKLSRSISLSLFSTKLQPPHSSLHHCKGWYLYSVDVHYSCTGISLAVLYSHCGLWVRLRVRVRDRQREGEREWESESGRVKERERESVEWTVWSDSAAAPAVHRPVQTWALAVAQSYPRLLGDSRCNLSRRTPAGRKKTSNRIK